MHTWARHVVQQAHQQIYATTYHNSSTFLNDHRDSDLPPPDSVPLLVPASPTKPRGNRALHFTPSRFPGRQEEAESEEEAERGPPKPQSFDAVCLPTPTFPAPPSAPSALHTHTRPFLHDASLHSAVRQHVFRYASTLSDASSPPFFQLAPDHSTAAFLSACTDSFYHSSRCSWYFLTHTVVKPLLSLCLSHTAVNGVLNTGHMFLLSSQQFLSLWSFHTGGTASPTPSGGPPSFGSLLDVGAGSGHITAAVSPFFESTTATEVSWMMTRRLARRGFSVYHTATLSALPSSATFDCVLCFNVLDRCSHPRTLLAQLRARLRTPSSLLLVATPLPLDPWVEVGKHWKVPDESLGVEVTGGDSRRCAGCMGWEETVERLSLLFIELGFAVLSVSRLPYISAGNAVKPFFTLDDALFVLSRTDMSNGD